MGYCPRFMTSFGFLALSLIAAKAGAQLALENINRRHVQAHASNVPPAFNGVIDAPTYRKSVQYTLAKTRLSVVELTYDTVVLMAVLFSGFLPWTYQFFTVHLGTSAWAMAAWLLLVGVVFGLLSLPLDWHGQFHLEEHFGFNTTTPLLWWMDRLKGVALSVALGFPLLALILKIIEWTGSWWWLWAWGALLSFQLLMMVLAPILIMPLFNKFTPLPDGALRDRLLRLAERTGFHAQSIQVMDGSKRSRHSNAFFTGFGRFRKIVLFDTLIQQLNETELEAVLAHEIGHYRKKHIVKLVCVSAVASLAAFYVLALLAQKPWFYEAFGFYRGAMPAALLVFALLSGTVSFWISPLVNFWSRRYEYQADSFAAGAMREYQSLVGALRKLNEKNLSNLTPHPIYSGFYYSHPTLLEREGALATQEGI